MAIGVCLLAGAEQNSVTQPIPSSITITNIAQLRKSVEREWRVQSSLALEGVVCSVSINKQALVLADASGAELLSFDFGNAIPKVGDKISLVAARCEITRRREGVALGRAPLITNDWLHRATEVSASVELTAGWHPIRVEWFNGMLAAELEVRHAEPDGELLPIPDTRLARAMTNGQAAEFGLSFSSYEGGWSSLPDFGRLQIKETGVVRNFDISIRSRSNNIGMAFTGWLHAQRSGLHTLKLRSDDGSRLLLGAPMPQMKIIGKANVPTFRQYFIGQVVGENDAYVWARAYGDVRRVELRDGRMELELRSPREGRLQVEILDGAGIPTGLLLNNRVSITGVSRKVTVSGGQQIYGLVTTASSHELHLVEAAPEVWAANVLRTVSDLPSIKNGPGGEIIVRMCGKLEQPTGGGAILFKDDTGLLELGNRVVPTRSLIGQEVDVLASCRPVAGRWVLEAGFFRAAIQKELTQVQPQPLLTTAEEVLRLKPSEAAQALPVRLRGVVTCLWPDYDGNAILQDATRGVFLRLPNLAARQGLQVGDFWEVEGTTAPGNFAPILNVSNLTRVSEGRLPEPVRPAWDQLINGSLDAQYIEIEGIITKVDDDVATLLTHWGKIEVQVIGRIPLVLEQYENRLVMLRGCLLAAWDEVSGQIRVGEIRLASATLSTSESVTRDPFAAPAKSLGDLLRFDIQASAFQRVKIAGQLLARRGDEFFLHTPDGGFRFFSKTADALTIGDLVDVSGFAQLEGPSPVLREAVTLKTGKGELPPPRLLGPGNFNNADNDALLVTCEATLINERGGPDGIAVLEFHAGLRPFVARTTFKADRMPKMRLGSVVQVTGVYVGQGTPRVVGHKLDGFELLVNSPQGFKVKAQPAWWTLRRLLAAVGVLAAVLAAAMLWVFQLQRRVESQTVIIREKVEREATLEERTRIARELHDTLEQALAGVSFQLGALAGMMRGLPDETSQMLERARMMVRHGQEEARRTVSNLRMLALEGGDLTGALEQMTRDAQTKMSIRTELRVHGEPETLSGTIENHLLRVAQEGLTNALKHGQAQWVQFDLTYGQEGVELKITDDGRGFDPSGSATTEAGHFGVLGMRERANKIGATLKIASQLGKGTTVTLQLARAKITSITPKS